MAERTGKRIVFQIVYDFEEMLKHGIEATPAVVIDGEVVCSGRMPAHHELASWIEARLDG